MAANTLKSVKINLSAVKPVTQDKQSLPLIGKLEPNLYQQALETQSKMDLFTANADEVPLSNSRGASV